jgi:hypothetical protein
MSCENVSTGGADHDWTLLPPFKHNWVCVNLRDSDTMYEVKKAIYVLSNVRTRLDTTLWTPQDENALRLLDQEAWARDYELARPGPLGWQVPSGAGIEQMALRLGWATNDARMNAEFPWLFYAMDVLGDAPGLLDGLKTNDPGIGASGATDEVEPTEPVPAPPAETPRVIGPAPAPPTPAAQAAVTHPGLRAIGIALGLVGLGAAVLYYQTR